VKNIILCLLFLPTFVFAQSSKSNISKIDQLVAQELPTLKNTYLDLHQSPELSLFEVNTSKKLSNELKKLGFEVTESFGGHGIVGIFKNGNGPTIMYRTDMDALPMDEKTELPYASSVRTANPSSGNEVGVMHSCGHDMHMTVWLGTAKMMVKLKDQWKGTLMMIGQPAEEIGAGAALMLEAGLFKKFTVPNYGIGLHCSPTIPAGQVGFGTGYTMANTESIDITVYGEGAHGASPHMSVDPIVIASLIVMDLQTIVSRNIDPQESAVVTVGSFRGGTAHNIIPDEVKLQLTVRTFKEEVRLKVHQRIREICEGVAIAAGLPKEKHPTVTIPKAFTPANFNDELLIEQLRKSASIALGESRVVIAAPQMVGEDFAYYGRTEDKIPTALFWLGTVPAERLKRAETGYKLPGLHSPFYFPEPEISIITGVKTTTSGLLDLFNLKSK
jgi:amidohydrolase